MRKIKLLLATLVMVAAFNITAFAGEWKQNDIGWWYQNDDNTYIKDDWLELNGKWYHFDENGYMQTGWLYLPSGTYYLESSGEMRTEDLVSGSTTYRFHSSGNCKNPWGDTKYNADGSTNYSNWVPFIYSNDNELKQGISSGNVIYKDGHYLASPDYANARTIENEIINKYTVGSKLSEDYTVVPHHEEEIFYYDPDSQYDDLDGIVDVY